MDGEVFLVRLHELAEENVQRDCGRHYPLYQGDELKERINWELIGFADKFYEWFGAQEEK